MNLLIKLQPLLEVKFVQTFYVLTQRFKALHPPRNQRQHWSRRHDGFHKRISFHLPYTSEPTKEQPCKNSQLNQFHRENREACWLMACVLLRKRIREKH